MEKKNLRKIPALLMVVLMVIVAFSACSFGDNTSPGELAIKVSSQTVAERFQTGTSDNINLVKVYLQRNGQTYAASPSPGFTNAPGACIEISLTQSANGSSGSYLISDLVPANNYSLVMVAGISSTAGFEPVYYIPKTAVSIIAEQRTSLAFDTDDTKETPLQLFSASPVKFLLASENKAWLLSDSGISGFDGSGVLTSEAVTKPDNLEWSQVDSLGLGRWFGDTTDSLWLNSSQGIHITAGAGAGLTLGGAVSASHDSILYSVSWLLAPDDPASTRIILSLLDGNVRFAAAESADTSIWEWADLAALIAEAGMGDTITLATFLKSLSYGDGYILAITSLGNFLFTDSNIDYLLNGLDWDNTAFGLSLLNDPRIATMFSFPKGTEARTVDAVRQDGSLTILFGTNKGLYQASHEYATGNTTSPSLVPGTAGEAVLEAKLSADASQAAGILADGSLLLVSAPATTNPEIRLVPAQAGVPSDLAGFAWLGNTLVLAGNGGISAVLAGAGN